MGGAVKIAVASSGLGHVARGIETWAVDTAEALAECGVGVVLFSGGELKTVALACFRRFDARTQRVTRLTPGFCWRWGLKQAYGWEQFSFWWRLWPKLRQGKFDILHVQDPMLAYWCRKFRKLGLVKTKEILAHGTEEPAEWLGQFEYVQHLAPHHLEVAVQALGEGNTQGTLVRTMGVEKVESSRHPYWTAIPNFVDVDVFRPVRDDTEKRACREKLGIPPDAFVIGTAATVKKPHKRIDYLIQEYSQFKNRPVSKSSCHSDPHLVIAGAKTPQSGELVALAESLAPKNITFLFDLSREQMPDFYRSLDVFVLASVFEMMPIAVLEALASGLPVIANRIPQLQWMIGEGGGCMDMAEDGALTACLVGLIPEWVETHGRAARDHAVATFSTDAVIDSYIDYYRAILGYES